MSSPGHVGVQIALLRKLHISLKKENKKLSLQQCLLGFIVCLGYLFVCFTPESPRLGEQLLAEDVKCSHVLPSRWAVRF